MKRDTSEVIAEMEAEAVCSHVVIEVAMGTFLGWIRDLKATLPATEPADAGRDEWKEAVIDACVVHCIDWHPTDPRRTIEELLEWSNKMALDPAISSDAQALVDRDAARPPREAAAVDEMPGADAVIREHDCTDEAARKFYAKGWNECRAALASQQAMKP